MKKLRFVLAGLGLLSSNLAAAIAPVFSDTHMLNDGYVVATFQKYVGPQIYVCPDEAVTKKGTCGPIIEGATPQQYLDAKFRPRMTRMVGIAPGSSPGKTVIFYQINPARMNGFASH